MHSSVTLKVGDLLHHPGTRDTIQLKNQWGVDLPELEDSWISGSISLIALNSSDIQTEFLDLEAAFNRTCDRCGKTFNEVVNIDWFEVKYSFNTDDSLREEEVLPIDPKDETINISEPLRHAFLLEESAIHTCDTCKLELENIEDESEDYGYTQHTIRFTQARK